MAEQPQSSEAGGDPIHCPANGNNNDDDKTKKEMKAAKGSGEQWKFCKGSLYYSSRLRAHGRAPPCIGTERSTPRVSASMSDSYKMVASREGNLTYFKYACIGYSIFSHGEDSSTKVQDQSARLPVCAGYELLLGKKSSSQNLSSSGPLPARAPRKHLKEDLYFVRSRTTSKVSKELLRATYVGRFTKSAELVACGVAKNLLRVGSYIKESLNNMLYPDRRRPK